MAGLLSWILVLAIVIGAFLALREWFCWYWKINEKLDVLKDISRKLDKVIASDGTTPAETYSFTGDEPAILRTR